MIFVGPQLWKWNGKKLKNKENLLKSSDDFMLITEDALKPLEEITTANTGDTYVYIKNNLSSKVLGVNDNGKDVVEEELSSEPIGEFVNIKTIVYKTNCVFQLAHEMQFTIL